ncbi:hypothetical protein CLU81_2311 [Flavobacterium sp. 9]|uniref:hypothetical protein n=1 Tax=Flavobacterium sp. 9 TaxID=2035198 RepID=UPI000C1A54FA|nr:hypothetical protein [Flavobacterium sp. 9]PIF31804.1 hypothetical protein CLU81_2311 [Flavobacterium sp. 9]
MKTNLKLTKVTISKLDNLNLKPLENGELQNVKAGGDSSITTVTVETIGGGWNDTSSITSCTFTINTDCYTKLS